MTKKFLFSAALLATVSTSALAQLPCEALSAMVAADAARAVDGGKAATPVKFTRDLRKGSRGQLVSLVRGSLGLSPGEEFDAELEAAVSSSQASLGFTPTGVVDANSFLNLIPLSASYRLQAAQQALKECARVNNKLRQDVPRRFIEVNLASQTLIAYDYDASVGESHEVLRSRVVVGAPRTQTPLEDFNLWALKFNPGWTPTSNILARNIAKGGKVNYKWLANHHMRIVDRAGNQVSVGDVTTSNWKQLRYSEPAGPGAALGALKFETTSGKNIYMHDTPEKRKFNWNVRLGSSGCVRVQEIEDLASWAFEATETNPKALRQFNELKANGKGTVRRLPATIPVYLTYRLVDFDEEGQVLYFADGYNRIGLELSVD